MQARMRLVAVSRACRAGEEEGGAACAGAEKTVRPSARAQHMASETARAKRRGMLYTSESVFAEQRSQIH